MTKLTAQDLKDTLWETLNGIKDESIAPAMGDAIASQAREILKTVNVQLRIAQQANIKVPASLIDFAGKD